MNKHRGSDFNDFLIEQGLTNTNQPMTPTPRTDEAVDRFPQPGQPPGTQWPEIVPAEFARQLERENQTFRAAQKACEDCDAPRVDRIAELERELATEREQLTANHEATKLLSKWLEDEREIADRLAGELAGIAWLQAAIVPNPAEIALAAWKEARRGTV
jgi:hypothetical protein